MKSLLDLIQKHKAGQPIGIYSVCSAHPLVIEAALRHASETQSAALIEATSNQVNQDGGYTGMRPTDFSKFVYGIADKIGFPHEKVLLGGDHLGPNCWQQLNADEAMKKADVLIREYVTAGFRKIHLDCSMSCADDPSPLSDEVIAARAARLCGVAEGAWEKSGGEAPVYIVGTEVPVPGGSKDALEELEVTSVEAAEMTIKAHKDAFSAQDLDQVWSRVVALVVQPGVEFDHHKVIDYDSEKAVALSQFIDAQPSMVYEAHSTDYQCGNKLEQLVKDHFAILKVGPGLTFALREALWALDQIEREWVGEDLASQLKSFTQKAMRDFPKFWRPYYTASGNQLELDCQYSLSDRIRYYWPQPPVAKALSDLTKNLDRNPPPLTLLCQYLPAQYQAIRAGKIDNKVESLVIHKITEVLQQYSRACQAA